MPAGSGLPGAGRNRLPAAPALPPRPSPAGKCQQRTQALSPAPGSLTSWGALREEVPEKKQKPGLPGPGRAAPAAAQTAPAEPEHREQG